MKIEKYFVLFISIIALVSCSKSTGPSVPDVTTTGDDLSNFQTIIADYDSVVFKNNDELLLKNKDVEEIVLIDKDGAIFEDLKRIEPNYTKVGNNYRLEFEITTIVAHVSYIKHYSLKFNMVDGSYIEIEQIVNLYKHPYENAEIFMIPEETVLLGGGGYIQDFDIVGDRLFYHLYGPLGLYRYNLSTRTAPDVLYDYPGGDHIATDENYVFIDYSHSRIERYNLDAGSIDLVFDLSQTSWADCDYYCSNLYIYGVAANNNIVYILVHNNDADNTSVVQFDYEGNFLNELPYPEPYGYNLEYYNGILFTYYYDWDDRSYTLKRFDLNSNMLLETKLPPTPAPDGISIVNGRFYYADYQRRIICSIPLSDLMD